MSDLMQLLSTMRRPRLLIRAARIGLADYRRDRDLTRVLLEDSPDTPERAVDALLAAEAEIEETRKTGDVTYSASRHIDILIALMAEARMALSPAAVSG